MILTNCYDSIGEIDASEWEKAVKDDYLLSYQYLRHVEKTMSDSIRYRYLLTVENSFPVAAAVLFEMRLDIATLLEKGRIKSIISGTRKVLKRAFTVKTLFVGSPPSTGNFGINISDECADSEQVINNIIDTVNSIAEKSHIRMILYKEMGAGFRQRYGHIFEKRGVCFGYDMPNNILDIRWDSDKEYLDSMRSKSRQAIIRSSEKLGKEGISSCIINNIGSVYSNKEYHMYLDVLHKSDNIFETLSKEYFSDFDNAHMLDPCLICIMKDEKIIGYFLTCNVSENSVSALFAGIDYRYNHDYDTYFNLFHQVIIYAVEHKKNRIVFGQNTYEVKQRLGCVTEDLYIAFYYRNRLIHKVLSRYSSYLMPKTEINTRRVFK